GAAAPASAPSAEGSTFPNGAWLLSARPLAGESRMQDPPMDYKAITTLAFMIGMMPSTGAASDYALQLLSKTQVNGSATSVVVEDFNADGRKDVAVLSSNN